MFESEPFRPAPHKTKASNTMGINGVCKKNKGKTMGKGKASAKVYKSEATRRKHMPRLNVSRITLRRQVFVLTSNPMFYTPGVIAWAQRLFLSEPERARKVLEGYPGLSKDAVRRLLTAEGVTVDEAKGTVTVRALTDPESYYGSPWLAGLGMFIAKERT